MFLIIFLWTPPHFWALSLLRSRRICRAPACRCCRWSPGRDETRRQILLYSLVLAPVGVAPALFGFAGLALWRGGAGLRRR